MKNAIGGVFTLQAIVVALIIIMCLLAFAVNYSKAFRVKNEIRSIIEKNDGMTQGAEQQINDMIRRYKYFLNQEVYTQACHNLGYKTYTGGGLDNGNGVFFCIKCSFADQVRYDEKGLNNSNLSQYRGAYYSVVTFVNLDLPMINKVIPFAANFFKVSGETALIYSSNNNNNYCLES